MSSHKPKGYAFGGLIKKARQRAVEEAKEWMPAWGAKPPTRAPAGTAGALAKMRQREEDAAELQGRLRKWSYDDRRRKIWDTTGMWLDRDTDPWGVVRETLKHEIPDTRMTTRHKAVSDLRFNKVSPSQLTDTLRRAESFPGAATEDEIAQLKRISAGLNLKSIPLNATRPIDDTVHHPLLKAAYPELWSRTTVGAYHPDSASGMAGNLGEFHEPMSPQSRASLALLQPGAARTRLSSDSPLGTLDSTLLHEYQHNLQNNFGWQGGAAPSTFEFNPVSGLRQSEAAQMENYFRTKGEADARLAQWRHLLAQRKGEDILQTPPWEMYSAPSVAVDEKDLILDTTPWENYLTQRYRSVR